MNVMRAFSSGSDSHRLRLSQPEAELEICSELAEWEESDYNLTLDRVSRNRTNFG